MAWNGNAPALHKCNTNVACTTVRKTKQRTEFSLDNASCIDIERQVLYPSVSRSVQTISITCFIFCWYSLSILNYVKKNQCKDDFISNFYLYLFLERSQIVEENCQKVFCNFRSRDTNKIKSKTFTVTKITLAMERRNCLIGGLNIIQSISLIICGA